MNFLAISEASEIAGHDFRCLKTHEARNRFGELADSREQAFTSYWKRWGFTQVLDPRISDYPDEELKTLPHDGFNIMDGSPSSEAGISAISPRIGQTAIVFDLGKPLAAQMEYAKRALKKRQKEHCGKLLQNRQHRAKWLAYLRTLDAREDGASWAEIAALHPNTARTEQTARDIWNAANALRFNFRFSFAIPRGHDFRHLFRLATSATERNRHGRTHPATP